MLEEKVLGVNTDKYRMRIEYIQKLTLNNTEIMIR